MLLKGVEAGRWNDKFVSRYYTEANSSASLLFWVPIICSFLTCDMKTEHESNSHDALPQCIKVLISLSGDCLIGFALL